MMMSWDTSYGNQSRIIALVIAIGFIVGGLLVIPFHYNPLASLFPSLNVSVDAIPDIGHNQQIVYADWEGQSPVEVEKYLTYPLTSQLLALPGIESVRSQSSFGRATIYLLFEDSRDFYWCRERILEQLASIPSDLIPENAQVKLGPAATAMGQVFAYTLQSFDEQGNRVSAWTLAELRKIQDYQLRYGFMAVPGVVEVSSIGGYRRELLVEPFPDLLNDLGLDLKDLTLALRESNISIGAQSLEINKVEYYIRAIAETNSLEELGRSIIQLPDEAGVELQQIARLSWAPASRSGILDRNGSEEVGGMIVAGFDADIVPLIEELKRKVEVLEGSLPKRSLQDSTQVHLEIKPYYDRSQLIGETLYTLQKTLFFEVLISLILVSLLLWRFSSALLIVIMIPLSVGVCFILMRLFNIQANIMSLAGIAIAIGSMVDYAVIITEEDESDAPPSEVGKGGKRVSRVMGPTFIALATTLISFLPLFFLDGAAGKLFFPLVLTKTFLLIGAGFLCWAVLPAFLNWRRTALRTENFPFWVKWMVALILCCLLAVIWKPTGQDSTVFWDIIALISVFLIAISAFHLLQSKYQTILGFLFKRKKWFFLCIMVILGLAAFSFSRIHREFMPSFSEGAFLFMPSSVPQASSQQMGETLGHIDRAIGTLPEVREVVGKAGRMESALDPAPMSMLENYILLEPEYLQDSLGRTLRFMVDGNGKFILDSSGMFIPSFWGKPYRQWRDHIRSEQDIWEAVLAAGQHPILTRPPRLHPIEARLIMLETGMRSEIGMKVFGDNLDSLQYFGRQLEAFLRHLRGVDSQSVLFDQTDRRPYITLQIDREAAARQKMMVGEVLAFIRSTIGGVLVGEVLDDRERYNIRLRYPRDFRQDPNELENLVMILPGGGKIRIGEVLDIRYESGPQLIRSESGSLCNYLYFNALEGVAETALVRNIKEAIRLAVNDGRLQVPTGVYYQLSGSFENTVATNRKMLLIIPLSLLIIAFLLWWFFKDMVALLFIGTSILIAIGGGMLFYSFYSHGWLGDWMIFSTNGLGAIGQENGVSVPVWIGFLVLLGIATDDAVLVTSSIREKLQELRSAEKSELATAIQVAGKKRLRPAMITTLTTLVALLPVIGSSGKGAEILIPMAVPVFGGMLFQIITIFVIPVLYHTRMKL